MTLPPTRSRNASDCAEARKLPRKGYNQQELIPETTVTTRWNLGTLERGRSESGGGGVRTPDTADMSRLL